MPRTVRASSCRYVTIALYVTAILLVPINAVAGSGTASSSGQWFVRLELAIPSGTPGTIIVRDGGLAVYAEEHLNFSLGIIPHVRDVELGLVDLEVVEVELEHGARTTVSRGRHIDTVNTTLNAESFVAVSGLPLQLTVVEISEDPWASRDQDRRDCRRDPRQQERYPSPVGGGDSCCIECGGGTWCGCEVTTPCGSCIGDC